MKIIKNSKDAYCTTCFFCTEAVLKNERVVCGRCGSEHLITLEGEFFEPIFIDDPAATYRASRYTPELPERRRTNRPWPKIKERRATDPLFI